LLGIVLIAAIISGAFFASTQEFRSGRNMLVEQRALAVSEFGLNSEIAAWNPARNLPGGLAVGGVDSLPVYVAAGDSANVSITRLNPSSFLVVSTGRANIPQPMLRSARKTSAFVRLAYPDIEPKGAITTRGNLTVQGSARVDGTNQIPTGWGNCAGYPTDPVPGVYASLTSTVEEKGAGDITTDPSVPPIVKEEFAGKEENYVNFGSETWTTLANNADIRIAAGAGNDFTSNVLPVGTDTTCVAGDTNWGEPWRTSSSIKGCFNRFPIIYSEGDLHLKGNTRGQGVLLVNGTLKLNGGFEFYGLVIVRDEIEKLNGTAMIMGAVLVRNATIGDPSWLGGNQDTFYSKCAVENALRGSAILVRAKDRSWAQLY
jgi:hypothetical protein